MDMDKKSKAATEIAVAEFLGAIDVPTENLAKLEDQLPDIIASLKASRAAAANRFRRDGEQGGNLEDPALLLHRSRTELLQLTRQRLEAPVWDEKSDTTSANPLSEAFCERVDRLIRRYRAGEINEDTFGPTITLAITSYLKAVLKLAGVSRPVEDNV
jgi:hypothetical protein